MEIQQLRVVAFRDGDIWVGQCLEHDISAQAADLKELQILLDLTIQADLQESMERHGKPFAGLDPAPQRFFRMWDECAGKLTPNPTDGGPTDRPKFDLALCA